MSVNLSINRFVDEKPMLGIGNSSKRKKGIPTLIGMPFG
jgi:hypothetical protein